MARYEIVAHMTRELPGETAEEAAAIFRRQLLSDAGREDHLLHLAVWRHGPSLAESPVPPLLRQQLVDFFTALESCAGEEEKTFRGRVESILTSVSRSDADDAGVAR